MTGDGDRGLRPVREGALVAPPEVVAAIAVAVEAVWPRPRPAAPTTERAGAELVWRFSGRWWSKPVPLRRDRPWASSGGEHGQVGTDRA